MEIRNLKSVFKREETVFLAFSNLSENDKTTSTAQGLVGSNVCWKVMKGRH